MLSTMSYVFFIIQLRRLHQICAKRSVHLKSGELTKFSSCRDISSEVLRLFHFIFHHDPRYFRRGIAKNIKRHMAQSFPSTREAIFVYMRNRTANTRHFL